MRQCADCRDGEHDNYDDDVRLAIVRDPDTKKLVKRAYMCETHRDLKRGEDYEVIEK